MSYLFRGSIMDAWLKYHGDDYQIKSINDGVLVDYCDDGGYEFRHLVKLEQDPKLNMIGRKRNLSSSWYAKAKSDPLEELKANTRIFFRRLGVDARYCLWTCFKSSAAVIAPASYTTTAKGLSFRMAQALKDPLEKASKFCFIPVNMRATNNYKHKSAVAVLVNYYPHPAILQFFQAVGVTDVDADQYALSEMIQLVWRSRIREGKEIDLYLPSERMRGLLNDWLNVAPF